MKETFYGTSGLVSARQMVDNTAYRVFYPDNSSSGTTKTIVVKPEKK